MGHRVGGDVGMDQQTYQVQSTRDYSDVGRHRRHVSQGSVYETLWRRAPVMCRPLLSLTCSCSWQWPRHI
jgi:hypothetical protein